MKKRKEVVISLGMVIVLLLTSVMMPVAAVNAEAQVQAAGPTTKATIKTLTGIGGKIYSAINTRKWQNECRTFMAATGEQLDVLEEKIDGLDKSLDETKAMLVDIENQLDGVSQQIKDLSSKIDKNFAQNTLSSRMASVNEMGALVSSLTDDLDKISEDGLSQSERAQRTANFIAKVESGGIEQKLYNTITLLTEGDVSGNESLAKDYLDYMKKGKPFYFQIYNKQVECYQNFSDIILSASHIMVEYYHYYSGPFNPKSRYITINQEDLLTKVEKCLDDLYAQLDINDDDKPDPGYNKYYGRHGLFIQDGIFKKTQSVRVRSTVNRKSYLVTIGGNKTIPMWQKIFNLYETPYGPKDEYLAAETISDGKRTYHPASSTNEIDALMKYYDDYNAKSVVKSSETYYDFLYKENPIVGQSSYDSTGPLLANLFIPFALWQIDAEGQNYVETINHNGVSKLTYEDAKKRVEIYDSDFFAGFVPVQMEEVFNYVFVENTEGGK